MGRPVRMIAVAVISALVVASCSAGDAEPDPEVTSAGAELYEQS